MKLTINLMEWRVLYGNGMDGGGGVDWKQEPLDHGGRYPRVLALGIIVLSMRFVHHRLSYTESMMPNKVNAADAKSCAAD